MNAERNYLALIGDVTQSRRLRERDVFQRKLLKLLEELNKEASTALSGPLTLTAGDEIQGLLAKPAEVVPLLSRLAEGLFPVRIVYGLGFGPLSTELLPLPTVMDGPCFHQARACLTRARKQKKWVAFGGFGEPFDQVIENFFDLISVVRSRWTETQAKYVTTARQVTQKAVAGQFKVHRSVVSESLKAARFAALRDAERALEAFVLWLAKNAEQARGSVKMAIS
jgi:hypothetical protein